MTNRITFRSHQENPGEIGVFCEGKGASKSVGFMFSCEDTEFGVWLPNSELKMIFGDDLEGMTLSSMRKAIVERYYADVE